MPISLEELSHKQFPPENHLVGSGLMHHNSVLFIGGAPKSYKSFLLATICLQMAGGIPLLRANKKDKHGRPAPIFPVQKPCRVLLLEQEVGEMDMKERLCQMLSGIEPAAAQESCRHNLNIHSCDHNLRLDTPDGVRRVRQLIEQVRPEVLAIDPLKEFHFADENSAQEMSRVLSPIKAIKDDYNLAVLITHHTSKPSRDSGREGPDLLRGSGYLFGWGDSFIMVRQYSRRRNALQASFTLRRGKPIPSLFLEVDPSTMLVEFNRWSRGREREDGSDDEGDDMVLA